MSTTLRKWSARIERAEVLGRGAIHLYAVVA